MKKKHKGTVFAVIGVLLITAAVVLCCINMIEDKVAEQTDLRLAQQLLELIPTRVPALPSLDEVIATAPADYDADEVEYPDYLLDPMREMPTQTLDGKEYLGVIEIPSLDISLPVLSECNMTLLKIAPGRYAGTVYQNNMVIGAHNYASQFGKLTRLSVGDTVMFTDVEGTVFSYTVTELETVKPSQVEYMITGDWDLTLFTCTWGGASRVTVRCDRSDTP